MPEADAEVMSAVADAARALRERAESWRPDEELYASMQHNDAAATAFSRAYEALRKEGRSDQTLDAFGMENASPEDMRKAADLLEQVARSEPSVTSGQRLSPELVRRYAFPATMVAIVVGGVPAVFGAVFLSRAIGSWELATEGRVVPLLFFLAAAAGCFSIAWYAAVSLVRFFRGEESRLFRTRRRYRRGLDPFEFKRDERTGARRFG